MKGFLLTRNSSCDEKLKNSVGKGSTKSFHSEVSESALANFRLQEQRIVGDFGGLSFEGGR
jgi:hypothetical protein